MGVFARSNGCPSRFELSTSNGPGAEIGRLFFQQTKCLLTSPLFLRRNHHLKQEPESYSKRSHRTLSTMFEQSSLRVQLLSVPDCPLVASVRKMLEKSLAQIPVDAIVEEIVGDYNSPTLLVDGFDVTGRPPTSDGIMSCRLDLPTEEQVLAALRGLTVIRCKSKRETQIQATAFQTLLHTIKPVSLDYLAKTMETSGATVSSCIDELRRLGQVRLDSDCHIVGAVGLSLTPTIHELSIRGTRFWAWCAFDVVGIFGSLHVSGSVRSQDPLSNEILRLDFIDGIPQDQSVVVFMADVSMGDSVCDCWCSKVNFFTSKQSAEAWSQANDISGSALSVGHLAPVAREVWSRFFP